MNRERIPVCYCGNRGIFGGIFMSALSVASNTDAALHIILLTMDLSDKDSRFLPITKEQGALMEKILKEKNPDSLVEIFDVGEYQKQFFSSGKNNKNAYTPYASIRLFLDLLNVPEKIIYLDADVMCAGDVREYYGIDITEYEFAATLDIVGRKFFRGRYCNSGVLLLNIPMIRKTGLFEKARKRICSRWMMMPDQSAIHKEATAKLVVPYRFNEQREIKPDTVFKHFCMGYKWKGIFLTSYNHKQWHREAVHKHLGIHDFDHIYEEYDRILAEADKPELIKI